MTRSRTKLYWTDDRGVNMLKGVEDDPDNPPRLPESAILYALRMSPVARQQFAWIVPNLLPEEQDRLEEILQRNPRMSKLLVDDQTVEDRFQNWWNSRGIRHS